MKLHVSTLLGLAMAVLATVASAEILTPPDGTDLLANRPASDFSMSSNYDHTKASGILNRKPDGGYAFHTKSSNHEWWKARFSTDPKKVKAVVVWNRISHGYRANSLEIELSKDGQHWEQIYAHDPDTYKSERRSFGNDGVIGGFRSEDRKDPLVVQLNSTEAKRGFCWIRISLLKAECLHLDSVQVIESDAKEVDKGRTKGKTNTGGKSKPKDDDD